jgi:ubiquinone/menaquinone biosynthesis C-methylase UbiE
MKTDKKILDVTCGSRSIWFNKKHPDALYCDRRVAEYEETFGKTQSTRHTVVSPDVVADFKDLPFEDNTFSLVVFDPPHRYGLKESWIMKRYGTYDSEEEMLDNIVRGFHECMRVLKPDGVLVFKWAELQIPTPEIIKAIGVQPLFGHHSGKKSNTNWLCFMKLTEE